MRDQLFNDLVAVGAVLVVVVAGTIALTAFNSPAEAGPPSGAPVSYLNLSIVINNTYSAAYGGSGWPQYTPANFTVPEGFVIVTIHDHDTPAGWTQCTCAVRGTVGGTEKINGTSVSQVNWKTVAHTFTVPTLGINVLSPALSTVTFTLYLGKVGQFPWMCMAPCGGGSGGFGWPMFAPGFMAGTMTVAPG